MLYGKRYRGRRGGSAPSYRGSLRTATPASLSKYKASPAGSELNVDMTLGLPHRLSMLPNAVKSGSVLLMAGCYKEGARWGLVGHWELSRPLLTRIPIERFTSETLGKGPDGSKNSSSL